MPFCPHCRAYFELLEPKPSAGRKRGPERIPTQERFWSYVEIKGDEECWEWKGHINKQTGYGKFTPHRLEPIQASTSHRWAYLFTTGESLSESDLVCHTCDNRKCCNPKHLFLGTAKSNTADMIRKGRMWHPPKPRGHDAHNSKLSPEQVQQIRELCSAGLRNKCKVARMFGVGRSTIGRIVRGEVYAD